MHLAVPEFFNTLEQSGISTWLRESDSVLGFYFVLVCHTLGLALLVGLNAAVDLVLLGFASGVPLKPLQRFFPIMWSGFYINAISGVFLVIAYPTKAFTNPVFYVKLTFIALALWTLKRIQDRVFGNSSLSEPEMHAKGRALAQWSLALWFVAITAGRLLAYTYRYRLYDTPR